eukprot:gnl/Trimastix_PCT/1636.p1 GENE.gnl/Trimastix_PCT/1636~~gnl/Trimastix_PCT/1636.p1  ORF type:complete len:694 (-),score=126.93 gnl/Trimastix_PCT/1636:1349-3142(-)
MNGARYDGEWYNNLAHGNGEMHFGPGDAYVGEFRDGAIEGHGVQTFPSGDRYEGDFVAGKYSGFGTFANAAERWEYVGEFLQDKFHGKGTLTWGDEHVAGAAQKSYQGDWLRGKRHGFGIMHSKDGRIYEGSWVDGMRHGEGVLRFPNGRVYRGNFERGKRSGAGVLEYPNGKRYEGGWSNDAAEGHGIFVYRSGDIYEGHWHLGKPDGRGHIQYVNGDRYQGDWVQGKATGHGKYSFANGDTFEGQFLNGAPHGRGSLEVPALQKVFEGNCAFDHEAEVLRGEGTVKFGGMRLLATWARRNQTGDITFDVQPDPTACGGSFDWEIDPSELTGGTLIGSGGFGNVYRGYWHGAPVAWKCVRIKEEAERREFRREVTIMSQLRHPNIIEFHGCSKPPDMRIVMEYMDRGSLYHAVIERQEKFTRAQKIDIMRKIARGMLYLHSRRVLHKDLKTLNVLLNRMGEVKITDFGLSKTKTHAMTVVTTTRCTPEYAAPEFLRSELINEAVDVFSFGMCMWEVWVEQVPFASFRFANHFEVAKAICEGRRPPLPKKVAPRYRDVYIRYCALMTRCWADAPTDRPSFREVLRELDALASICPKR